MDKKKMRLDQLLVNRGLAVNKSLARSIIMSGRVFQGERRLDKPGQAVATALEISLRGREHPWVSRGGLKLAHGLTHFGIVPHGLVALDIGASTGGFTDVLLTSGASCVYAVDVGYGQLVPRLRCHPRVIVLERTNARFLSPTQIPDPIALVVCDVSFIGLRTVLPAPLSLTCSGAYMIALIKPQFEVGRRLVGKGGVVRDPLLQAEACSQITGWLASQPGWKVLGIVESPVQGAHGNREFLVCGTRIESCQAGM